MGKTTNSNLNRALVALKSAAVEAKMDNISEMNLMKISATQDACREAIKAIEKEMGDKL
jgi:hypothetical protein